MQATRRRITSRGGGGATGIDADHPGHLPAVEVELLDGVAGFAPFVEPPEGAFKVGIAGEPHGFVNGAAAKVVDESGFRRGNAGDGARALAADFFNVDARVVVLVLA